MKWIPVAPVLLLAAATSAEKDSNYYPWGSNPNENNPMFWNDAINVLHDLTKFQALYIKYHSCVWSPYAPDSSDYACTGGSGANDDHYWYMGSTPCFRANAAFSLYGILLPDENTNDNRRFKSRELCSKATYINSFFTTHGAMTISNAFGFGDDMATVYCSNVQVSNSYQGGGDNNNNNNQKKYMSTTTGCVSGQFVYDAFQGKYCDGNKYSFRVDVLEDYNANMEEITCTKIWDYDVNVLGSNRRDLGYGSDAEAILYYSKSCSVDQYPGVCPDPFGTKKRSEKKFNAVSTAPYHSKAQMTMVYSSLIMMAVGVVFFLLAAVQKIFKKDLIAEAMKAEQKEKKDLYALLNLLHDKADSRASSRSVSSSVNSSITSKSRKPTGRKYFSSRRSQNNQDPNFIGNKDSMLSEQGINVPEPSIVDSHDPVEMARYNESHHHGGYYQPDGIMMTGSRVSHKSSVDEVMAAKKLAKYSDQSHGGAYYPPMSDNERGDIMMVGSRVSHKSSVDEAMSAKKWATDPNRYKMPEMSPGTILSDLSSMSSRSSGDARAAANSIETAHASTKKGSTLTVIGSK